MRSRSSSSSSVESPEQLVVDPHAERGGQAEHVALLVGQVGDASEEDVAERVGQVVGVRRIGGQQLLGEERIALGAPHEVVEQVRARARAR